MSSKLRHKFAAIFIFAVIIILLLLYMTNAVLSPALKFASGIETRKRKLQFVSRRNELDGTLPPVTNSTPTNSPLITPLISTAIQSTTASLPPEPTPRPRSCSGCMQHNFRILLQPKPCQSSFIPDIVFVVISSPRNTQQRHAIRNSWGYSTIPLRTIFLIGSPKDPTYNANLRIESALFGDILQEDFVDSYGNLTYKTMMAFKWVKNNCQQAEYVFKTDDDMWVNVKEFRERVRELQMQDKVGGMCFLSAGPIRNPHSKWYASSMQYPESTYPGFCTGTAYFMTANTAVKLFDISPNIPFFYLEDIYVSLCAERAGVKLLPVNGFYNYRVAPGDWCHYKQRLITSHGVSPDEILMLTSIYCD